MSDILIKVNQVGLNLDWPIAGQNNSSSVFKINNQAILAGLTQASDELTRIQKTRFTFSGDATGSSASIGSAISVGSADPSMEVAFTLANVLTNPGSFSTNDGDFRFTFDAKGRLVTVASVQHQITWATGHQVNKIIAIGGDSMGSGTGALQFPIFQFDSNGRLTETRINTINYGLQNHTLSQNSLLIGKTGSKSGELAAPTGTKTQQLIYDGSSVVWQEIQQVDPNSQVANVIGGEAIKSTANAGSVTVALDLTKVSGVDSLEDGDLFLVQDISAIRPKTVSLADIRTKMAKVKLDTSPELGGPLNTADQFLWSSNANGVVLQSSRMSPAATLSVGSTGLLLTGSATAPVIIDAPNLSLNGILMPTTRGAAGQVLTMGALGLEWSTPVNYSLTLPKMIFVAPTGSDLDGNGSMAKPYSTINGALALVPNNSNDLWTVVLMGGTYNESLNIQNKKKLALESLFTGEQTVITGQLQLNSGIDEFYMSNIKWDNTAVTDSNQPIWLIGFGLVRGTVRNCAFLRSQFSDTALSFFGQTTGPIKILECEIKGTVKSEMELTESGDLIIESLEDKLDRNIPIESTDAQRSLSLTDVGRYIRVNMNSDNTLMVPDYSEVPFRVGATIRVAQAGTGRTSVVPKTNATINTPNGYVLRKRFSSAILTYIGQDIWDLSGDLDESITIQPLTRADNNQVSVDSDQITVDNG